MEGIKITNRSPKRIIISVEPAGYKEGDTHLFKVLPTGSSEEIELTEGDTLKIESL